MSDIENITISTLEFDLGYIFLILVKLGYGGSPYNTVIGDCILTKSSLTILFSNTNTVSVLVILKILFPSVV